MRLKNFIIFLILLLVEVFIALFVHDKFIRPFIGDILVVILIYFFIKSIFINEIKHLPVYIFLFAFSVEFLQYINIVEILGLSNNPFFSALIGTTFDIKDILCYLIGCVIIFYLERRCNYNT